MQYLSPHLVYKNWCASYRLLICLIIELTSKSCRLWQLQAT